MANLLTRWLILLMLSWYFKMINYQISNLSYSVLCCSTFLTSDLVGYHNWLIDVKQGSDVYPFSYINMYVYLTKIPTFVHICKYNLINLFHTNVLHFTSRDTISTFTHPYQSSVRIYRKKRIRVFHPSEFTREFFFTRSSPTNSAT